MAKYMMPQIENVHPAGVVSNSYLSDMFPVTLLKNVEFPLPAKALNIAVKMKHNDTKIMPKILTHLWVFPLLMGINFESTPLVSSIFWLNLSSCLTYRII